MRSIEFSNFKAYRERTTIPIKRLNIIMGCNSSGKSSIFHFLQLLKQSTSSQNNNVLVFSPIDNKQKDLISFSNVVFSHNCEAMIEFSVHGNLTRHRSKSDRLIVGFKAEYSIKGDGRSSFIDKYGLCGKLQEEEYVELFEIRGIPTDSAASKAIEYKFTKINDENIKKFDDIDEFLEFARSVLKDDSLRSISAFLGKVTVEFNGISAMNLILKKPKSQKKKTDASKDRMTGIHKFPIDMVLPFWGSGMHEVISSLIRCNFIGPLRDQILPFYSNRDIPPDDYVGSHGENLGYYFQNPKIVDSINEAFHILEIPYKLVVEDTAPVDGLAVFLQTLGDNAINIRPDSVGTGISQLIPILVECSINKDSTTLIEQPELHLHPRQHVLLAEFLIKSLLENKGQSIWVETHSEYLLQGILEHAKRSGLSASDVNIICVNSLDGEARLECVEPRKDYSYSFPFDMKLFPLLDFFAEI